MSWTESDLTALTSAISKGVKSVAYRDRKVEYRDLSEMLELKSVIEVELGLKNRSTRIYPSTGTGL